MPIFRHIAPRMFRFFRKKPANPPATPDAQQHDVQQPDAAPPAAPETHAPQAELNTQAQPFVAPAPEPVSTPVVKTVPEAAASESVAEASPAFPAPASIEPASIEPAYEAAPAPVAAPTSWRERLRNSGFAKSFSALFSSQPKLNEDFLEELETCLLTSDVGVTATTIIIEDLRQRIARNEFSDARGLLNALRGELIALLVPVAEPLNVYTGAKPFVILTVGVNGVGKTTTIGKLARRYLDERLSIMLAAGDTFRAAAVEQLKTWGERNGVHVAAQGNGADPAAVVFDALQTAKARGIDLLIADTAGRLHTQQGLMDELGKVRRVLGKIDPTAPHEVLQVIDGTTGQNAISQVRQFQKAAGVTGLIVTKLDGSAKGGVIFALAREFGLPIRYVGLGEGMHDLRAFDPYAFVDALLPDSLVSR